MPPKKPAQPPASKPPAAVASPAPAVAVREPRPTTSIQTLSNKSSPQEVALHVWHRYLDDTPKRTMLLDVFMLFLVLVGAVQFLYCLLVGNYVCAYMPGLLCDAKLLSLSTLSSLALVRVWANSSSLLRSECRRQSVHHRLRLQQQRKPLRNSMTKVLKRRMKTVNLSARSAQKEPLQIMCWAV